MKTGRGGCQEACRDIKGAAGSSGKIWLCTACDNNLHILHMSVLCGRVATQKPFFAEKNTQALLVFQNKIHPVFLKACGKMTRLGITAKKSKVMHITKRAQ